tara:strand:+ start:590 stop:763 length:174 start_codon:yes stop_codon:yes gene_type:complete
MIKVGTLVKVIPAGGRIAFVLEAIPPRKGRHDIVKVRFMEGNKSASQLYDVKDLKLI